MSLVGIRDATAALTTRTTVSLTFCTEWPLFPFTADFQQLALKAIAGHVVKNLPAYAGKAEIPLYIPGELLRQTLVSSSDVVLHISEFNPGAAELAAELQARYPAIKTTNNMQSLSGTSDVPTHFMLYLNFHTFVGDNGARLAEQVRFAMSSKLPIVMPHENDLLKGGCPFER